MPVRQILGSSWDSWIAEVRITISGIIEGSVREIVGDEL